MTISDILALPLAEGTQPDSIETTPIPGGGQVFHERYPDSSARSLHFLSFEKEMIDDSDRQRMDLYQQQGRTYVPESKPPHPDYERDLQHLMDLAQKCGPGIDPRYAKEIKTNSHYENILTTLIEVAQKNGFTSLIIPFDPEDINCKQFVLALCAKAFTQHSESPVIIYLTPLTHPKCDFTGVPLRKSYFKAEQQEQVILLDVTFSEICSYLANSDEIHQHAIVLHDMRSLPDPSRCSTIRRAFFDEIVPQLSVCTPALDALLTEASSPACRLISTKLGGDNLLSRPIVYMREMDCRRLSLMIQNPSLVQPQYKHLIQDSEICSLDIFTFLRKLDLDKMPQCDCLTVLKLATGPIAWSKAYPLTPQEERLYRYKLLDTMLIPLYESCSEPQLKEYIPLYQTPEKREQESERRRDLRARGFEPGCACYQPNTNPKFYDSESDPLNHGSITQHVPGTYLARPGMIDPVLLPSGDTVDRLAIEMWLKETGCCPFTEQPLTVDQLKPNEILIACGLAAKQRLTELQKQELTREQIAALPPLQEIACYLSKGETAAIQAGLDKMVQGESNEAFFRYYQGVMKRLQNLIKGKDSPISTPQRKEMLAFMQKQMQNWMLMDQSTPAPDSTPQEPAQQPDNENTAPEQSVQEIIKALQHLSPEDREKVLASLKLHE